MDLLRVRVARPAATGAVLAAAALLAGPAAVAQGDSTTQSDSTSPGTTQAGSGWNDDAYRGEVEVIPGDDEAADMVSGVVFEDADRSSTHDDGEKGVAGVQVSNGRDVVTTDSHGRYELPLEDGMDFFVTQPRGYQVPVDEDNVAQFAYTHMPQGSPELEYGGLEPTGPAPEALNFPLEKDKDAKHPHQSCVIGGDVQTYDEDEVEYARAGAFSDLAAREDYSSCGALFIGDVVGDDLALYDSIRELSGMLNGPARFLPGNHDLDFDAESREHSVDTFRAQLGPQYYSYDVGKLHVVALNSIEYPVGDGYNGALGERQLEWLRRDIAEVPEDRAIVLATHIPLLNFADQGSDVHQVDEVAEIYEILEGREVITVGGHTHSIENLRAGDSLTGWEETFGVEELPFTHLTAGAISGDWFSGEMLDEGYPTAIQRDGGVPGVITLEARGEHITERFTARGDDGSTQMSLGLNTPAYRDWFTAHEDDAGEAPEFESPLEVPQEDLGEAWLTANFWMGGTGSTVEVSLDGGEPVEAERTQQMRGEGQRVGAEHSDPTAVQQQLVHGGSIADRSMHLWRLDLPEDLEPGVHTAEVTATDVHGEEFTDSVEFEVTD
ncbi:calcineurin-like phosphoesterase C-terminal domain-containing protein [Nesterenkonia sp. K-15-9-6]|uniref:calcineurin-like phosphoesterase C-terminal domain-containing protein n=1 Tax=Nesterenkonia sp. K-15-9-6 TaxID=3093918 RepID=UPI004044DD3D